MEYFCKYLSICYLGSANPSHGDKNSGEDGFPLHRPDCGLSAPGRDAVMAARVASVSIRGLRTLQRTSDLMIAPRCAALLLTRFS